MNTLSRYEKDILMNSFRKFVHDLVPHKCLEIAECGPITEPFNPQFIERQLDCMPDPIYYVKKIRPFKFNKKYIHLNQN